MQPFLLQLISFGKGIIIPSMIVTFVGLIVTRFLIYYTVMRQETFTKEFEKRVHKFLEAAPRNEERSFFVIVKKIFEVTFYEMFEKRAIMKRRKLDYVTEPGDRLFMIHSGSARLVSDTLKEIKYLSYKNETPPLLEITKSVMGANPFFNRLFGIIPIGPVNDFLSMIPGLFIVAGIFGTFLGIMQALPELGSMNIRDPDSTKMVMDTFLARTAFSMGSSTIGILLSVIATTYNNFINPEKLFMRTVERLERCFFRVWIRCHNNLLPDEIPGFDENKDALEALAELAVDKELMRLSGTKPVVNSAAAQYAANGAPPPLPNKKAS
ncbi:MAG: hypothetical protein AABZ55_08550 [Bdellovibrionota bacterium]